MMSIHMYNNAPCNPSIDHDRGEDANRILDSSHLNMPISISDSSRDFNNTHSAVPTLGLTATNGGSNRGSTLEVHAHNVNKAKTSVIVEDAFEDGTVITDNVIDAA